MTTILWGLTIAAASFVAGWVACRTWDDIRPPKPEEPLIPEPLPRRVPGATLDPPPDLNQPTATLPYVAPSPTIGARQMARRNPVGWYYAQKFTAEYPTQVLAVTHA